MLLWSMAVLVAVSGFSGCASAKKKKQKRADDMADVSGDTSFQAFQGLLRKAVAKRDVQMLSSMMMPNFGYGWGDGEEGAGVFEYWNRNNLWPELELVLREKFAPNGNYMVAPSEATFDTGYRGYRAGLVQVHGSWRFAYFVPAPPDSEASR